MDRAEYLFEEFKKEGEDLIDEFIIEKKSEELFLDFKTSAQGGTGKFSADDCV